MKLYKFKNNKYSVVMKLIKIENDGTYILQHSVYPIIYKVKKEDLEEYR